MFQNCGTTGKKREGGGVVLICKIQRNFKREVCEDCKTSSIKSAQNCRTAELAQFMRSQPCICD